MTILQDRDAHAGAQKKPNEMPKRLPRWRGLPAVSQLSEMDCGAACLSTIAATYGKKIGINRMRDLARVGKEGATLANLARAGRELGFDTRMLQSTIDDLANESLPAIVNWKGYHWIVVHRVETDRVVVADPARGLIRIPKASFVKDFTGYCLILSPTGRLNDLTEEPSPIANLIPYFAKLRRPISEVLLAALAGQIVAASLPLFSRFMIDDVIMQGNDRWLLIGFVALAGSTLMQIFLSWIRQELAFSISIKANLSIVDDVYHRLIRMPSSYFDTRTSGDVISRLEEQQNITNFFIHEAVGVVENLFAVIVYVAIMSWFDPGLTILATSFSILYTAVVRFISPRLRTAFGEAFEKHAEQSSHIIETLRGIETIKSIGAGIFVRWKLDNLYASSANTTAKILRYSVGAETLTGFITKLAGIIILFACANKVMAGAMSIGVLVAFTMFSAALFAPISGIVHAWDEFQHLLTSAERLNDILDRKPEFEAAGRDSDRIPMPRPRGTIRIQRLAFRYYPDDFSNVLQNISLSIEAGEKVAFVGRSGCGKSTLLKLIGGRYQPSDGRILVDGFDTKDVWLPSLRRHLGSLPQQAMIFAGSVRDNIALARPDAPIRDVIEAARLADAAEFIDAMPGGYEALLSEQGLNLSGGQRQRIAIARIFLQNPAILMLDEPTSALDTATERRILDNIAERFKGRTVLTVAHRLSTVRHADRIVVFNKGLVAEQGRHQELMEAKGLYFRLNSTEPAAGLAVT